MVVQKVNNKWQNWTVGATQWQIAKLIVTSHHLIVLPFTILANYSEVDCRGYVLNSRCSVCTCVTPVPVFLLQGVSKPVYSGIYDLFRHIWKGIIQEFIASPDCKMDSVFLLFRLACYVYLDETVPSKSAPRRMTSVRVSTPRMDTSANQSELFQTPSGGTEAVPQPPTFAEPDIQLDSSPDGKVAMETTESHNSEAGEDKDVLSYIPRGRPMGSLLGGHETMRRYRRIKEQHSRDTHKVAEKAEEEQEGGQLTDIPDSVEGIQATASVGTVAPIHSTPKPSTDKQLPDSDDLFFTPLTHATSEKQDGEDVDGASFSRPRSTPIPNSHPSARKRPSQHSSAKPLEIPFSRRLSTESTDSLTVLSLSGIGDPQIQSKTLLAKLLAVFAIPQKWSRHFWNNLVWSVVTSERACISWNESTPELCKR